MARYIKSEMNDLNGKESRQVYYRMKIEGNMDMDQLVERIAYPGSGLDRGTVVHVIDAVARQLAYSMAAGQSVTIEGIGTFKARLGMKKGKEVDSIDAKTKRNAQSIEVNGIHYRADKELVSRTNRHCDLERGGVNRVGRSPYTAEERLARAQAYLETHHCMHIADYMALTKLKRTSATTELQRLSSDPSSGIRAEGWGSHRIYVRREPMERSNG